AGPAPQRSSIRAETLCATMLGSEELGATSPSAGRGCRVVVDAGEVDESALRICVGELQAHAVADIEPCRTLLDAALDRRVENTRPRPLVGRAGDDSFEFLADPVREQIGGGRLSQEALHLLGIVLFLRTVRRERLERVAIVRYRLSGKGGLDQPLRDEIWVAPVRCRGVSVVVHRGAKVAGDLLAREAGLVIAAAEQLDDR